MEAVDARGVGTRRARIGTPLCFTTRRPRRFLTGRRRHLAIRADRRPWRRVRGSVFNRFGGASTRLSERDGVTPLAHRHKAGPKPVAVISRGSGAHLWKQKLWIARVGLNMLRNTVAHEARASATARSAAWASGSI